MYHKVKVFILEYVIQCLDFKKLVKIDELCEFLKLEKVVQNGSEKRWYKLMKVKRSEYLDAKKLANGKKRPYLGQKAKNLISEGTF